MTALLLAAYWTAVAGLLAYGLNCHVLAAAYLRRRRRGRATAQVLCRVPDDHTWPTVTVQLPLYDEALVAARLLGAVGALDYPLDRLHIQVLDDSTDATTGIVAREVARLSARGLSIEHVRRAERRGFKAGALAHGMERDEAELLAIFDADFVPDPDTLRRMVPCFRDPAVGLVQARWGHLNRDTSWLTRVQALAIDGHFGVEQAARAWSGWMLNFNGTAGLWRRRAIEDAGGWTADTLTEDLDLSYRAQLAGWRVVYLQDVEVPAEIPADLLAFKSQQRRWAQGSIQTALKLLPRVLTCGSSPMTRLQAVLHLTHYLVHPLMVAVALLAPLVLLSWEASWPEGALALGAVGLALGTLGPSTLYVVSQRGLGRPLTRLAWLPLLMLTGCGIAVSNTTAVVAALLGRRTPFVRTPKRALSSQPAATARPYALPPDRTALLEAALALWATWGLVLHLRAGQWTVGPFLALYALGFGLVAWCSFRETRAQVPADRTDQRNETRAPRPSSTGAAPTSVGGAASRAHPPLTPPAAPEPLR